uniref:flagellin N-terminal helical domain-containing protein n=1 Tax=Spirillospora albida TaxID=58123 RepID=UPI0004C2203E
AQTAEGALTETHSILQRMRDLAVQSANGGSQDQASQKAADKEFQELKKELTRIANTTSFGSQKLLDGTYNGTFQVGSNGDDTNERISVDLSTATVGNLTGAGLLDGGADGDLATAGDNVAVALIGSGADGDYAVTADNGGVISDTVNVATLNGNVQASQAAIEKLDTAISKVSDVRAQLGATQNRFEHTIN